MLVQFGKKVYVVFTEDGFTYGNCILVDDDIRLVIDSGASGILDQVDPENVDILINTHHHYDHVRGNELFTNAQILLHPIEHPCMQSLDKIMAVEGWSELMHKDLKATDPALAPKPWRVDGEVNDGQVVDCGSTKLVVLHTPGHSKGHCAFYFPEEDLAFLGDICLTKVGPWYGEDQADLSEFIASINRIIELRPAAVATSHVNQVLTNPGQVLGEYRDRILKREQRILRQIKGNPSTIDQLADRHMIYRQHPSPFVLFWEKSMLKNHLARLINLGLAKELDRGVYEAV
jgi:glyoxylase-like metal-dependent hydrolase (beta-lactamase superfamily II)